VQITDTAEGAGVVIVAIPEAGSRCRWWRRRFGQGCVIELIDKLGFDGFDGVDAAAWTIPGASSRARRFYTTDLDVEGVRKAGLRDSPGQ